MLVCPVCCVQYVVCCVQCVSVLCAVYAPSQSCYVQVSVNSERCYMAFTDVAKDLLRKARSSDYKALTDYCSLVPRHFSYSYHSTIVPTTSIDFKILHKSI